MFGSFTAALCHNFQVHPILLGSLFLSVTPQFIVLVLFIDFMLLVAVFIAVVHYGALVLLLAALKHM